MSTKGDNGNGGKSAKLGITFAERTDVGRTRDENQDALGHANFGRERLFVVCDGMGGHAGGSTASRLGVETFIEVFGGADVDKPATKRLTKAIQAANKRVFDAAKGDKSLKGMGTTVVALLIDLEEGVARVAHVGDSRAYLARGSVFRRVTRDHTMVQQMVDDGILTDAQAAEHPHGNVISRSLGGGKSVEVEHLADPIPIEDGDLWLLCSDGLSGYVSEPDMAEMLWGNKPKAAAAAMIAQANANGGEDNITVQIVRIGSPPSAPDPDDVEIIHPETKPSGLLDELRERASAMGAKPPKVADVPTDAEDAGESAPDESSDGVDDDLPAWPQADEDHSDLTSPLFPAVVFGLFIGMICFLAIYLAVDQVFAPPPEEEPAVEAGDEPSDDVPE